MMHRSMPAAKTVIRPCPDGAGDIVFRLPYRLLELLPPGHKGGDRRGQRTAGAVVVTGCDAFSRQNDQPFLIGKIETIMAISRIKVTAFDQHTPAA